ncbi:hypothetical protein O1611_g946 [Lasiodiplodia mahajangana]|uniref:Uncharacterized protein n=1 Tax=Lasiodiplodia mahajangana TaxID=1108764 RepID=A0ACC2JZ44_9PEZI|nr:hypothetical protein O1611_g946 [Lasiodiplodia mahajangana]
MARGKNAENASKNLTPEPPTSRASSSTLPDPSAQLTQESVIVVPSSIPIRPGSSPKQPPEKRARADTAGTPLPTEEEIKAQELRLRLQRLEREEQEEQRRSELEASLKTNTTNPRSGNLDYEFAEIRELPSIVQAVAAQFPGVDWKQIMAIFRGEFEPINLIKLRAGVNYTSNITTSLHASQAGNITIKAPLPRIEAYGSDISLWAHCFSTFIAIYSRLFESQPHVALAINDFARIVYELSTIHELKAVILFAAARIKHCLMTPHTSAPWSERNREWEHTHLTLATLKSTPRAGRTFEKSRNDSYRNKSRTQNKVYIR